MKHVYLDIFVKIVFVVVVVIGLPPQPLFSQAKFLHISSNEKGAPVKTASGYSILKSAHSDSIIYYSSIYPTDSRFVVHANHLVSGKNSELRIENSKKAKPFFLERIESFAVNGNKMVFVCSNHVFFFTLTSETTIRYDGLMENTYSFLKCLPIGDKFLLYVQYNFHPRDEEYKHVWATLDPVKRELVLLKFQPDENSMFGSMVNSWIDTYNSKIVYADPLNYSIRFYNEKFEQIDSIQTDEFAPNKEKIANFKDKNLYSKDAISSLITVDDSLLTRIRKVYYLNDSTVMALVRLPHHFLRADYWRKGEEGWKQIAQDNTPEWYIEGETYSRDRITYTDFYQNVYDYPYIGNYTFCLVYLPYIPIVETTSFNRNSNYFKLQNDAIQNNDLFFGIKKITIDLPVR